MIVPFSLFSLLTTLTSLSSFTSISVAAPARQAEKYVDMSEQAVCMFTSELQLSDQFARLTLTIKNFLIWKQQSSSSFRRSNFFLIQNQMCPQYIKLPSYTSNKKLALNVLSYSWLYLFFYHLKAEIMKLTHIRSSQVCFAAECFWWSWSAGAVLWQPFCGNQLRSNRRIF